MTGQEVALPLAQEVVEAPAAQPSIQGKLATLQAAAYMAWAATRGHRTKICCVLGAVGHTMSTMQGHPNVAAAGHAMAYGFGLILAWRMRTAAVLAPAPAAIRS